MQHKLPSDDVKLQAIVGDELNEEFFPEFAFEQFESEDL